MGTLWCAEVKNPLGYYDGGVPTPQPIEEEGGGDPKGCLCADQETHAFLFGRAAMTGEAVVTSNDIQDYCPAFAFRQAAYIAARDRCEELAAEMSPVPDDYTECTTNIDDDDADMSDPLVTPLYQDGFEGDCMVMIDYGGVACSWEGPGGSWDDAYTLSNEITYNSMQDKYWISNAFYWDLVENPAWLMTDGTRFKWVTDHYELDGCAARTICSALGLQDGDIPVSINSMDLDTVEDALAAYSALLYYTNWTLTVERNGTNITLNYGRPAV